MKQSPLSLLSASSIHSTPILHGKQNNTKISQSNSKKHFILSELKLLRSENEKLVRKIQRNNLRIDAIEQYILGIEYDIFPSESVSFNATFDQENVVFVNDNEQEDQDTIEENYLALNQNSMLNCKSNDISIIQVKSNVSDDTVEEVTVVGDDEDEEFNVKDNETPNIKREFENCDIQATKLSKEYQEQYDMMLFKRQILEEIISTCPVILTPQFQRRVTNLKNITSHPEQRIVFPTQKRVHFDNQVPRDESMINEPISMDTHDCGVILNSNNISQDYLNDSSPTSLQEEILPSSIQEDYDMKYDSSLNIKDITAPQFDPSSNSISISPNILQKINDLEDKVNLLIQNSDQFSSSNIQHSILSQKAISLDLSSIILDPSSIKKILDLSTFDYSFIEKLNERYSQEKKDS